MSGPYDSHYAFNQPTYNQYPQQGYYDYNQSSNPSYNQSSYPSQGFADNRGYDQSYSNSNQGYYDSQPQYNQPSNGPAGTEQDRGLLGALAGGAAGGYGGHKAGHGFLGTIGGAIVGSLVEDFGKKKHKQHKHHGGRRDQSVSGQSASGLGAVASSFFNQKR